MFDINPSFQLLRKFLPPGANMPQQMMGAGGGMDMGNVTGSPVAEAPQMMGGMEIMPKMNPALMGPPPNMGTDPGMGRIQPVGRGITGSMPPPAMGTPPPMMGGNKPMAPKPMGGMMSRFAGKGPQKSKNRY